MRYIENSETADQHRFAEELTQLKEADKSSLDMTCEILCTNPVKFMREMTMRPSAPFWALYQSKFPTLAHACLVHVV